MNQNLILHPNFFALFFKVQFFLRTIFDEHYYGKLFNLNFFMNFKVNSQPHFGDLVLKKDGLVLNRHVRIHPLIANWNNAVGESPNVYPWVLLRVGFHESSWSLSSAEIRYTKRREDYILLHLLFLATSIGRAALHSCYSVSQNWDQLST